MDELLEQLVDQCRPYASEGRLASYIPELTKADPNALGVYLISSDGKHYCAGDYTKKFTIQSVVKPILLLPMSPQITKVNGAQDTHPDVRSNNPIPNAPASAPVLFP